MPLNKCLRKSSCESYRDDWIQSLVEGIDSVIHKCINQKGNCSVMLTGGKTAKRFYLEWAKHPNAAFRLQGVELYLGDERAVPPDEPESNFRLLVDSLLLSPLPSGVIIHPMNAHFKDLNAAADAYAKILPDQVDIILLSIGADGHIASIFPGSDVVGEVVRKVVPATSLEHPCKRLTITRPVITNAKNIFVMAIGEDKKEMYLKAKKDPADLSSIPARLVLDKNWIFEGNYS